jgi:hypothetical protein
MQGACGEGAHEQSLASAQTVARGAARCASQILDRGALSVARGTARCASHDALAIALRRTMLWPLRRCALRVFGRGA